MKFSQKHQMQFHKRPKLLNSGKITKKNLQKKPPSNLEFLNGLWKRNLFPCNGTEYNISQERREAGPFRIVIL